MNILLIKHFFVGFIVSEIQSVRIRALFVFSYFPLPITHHLFITLQILYIKSLINIDINIL